MARKLTEEELSQVTGGDVTSANAVGYQAPQFAFPNIVGYQNTQFAGNTATQEGGAIFLQNNGGAALAQGIVVQRNETDSVR